MKLNPNDPCRCGSKKKYKSCCKSKDDRNRIFTIFGSIVGLIFLTRMIFPPAPELPDAPPGKVWSEEHGHWHDASNTLSGRPPELNTPQEVTTPPATQEIPQPEGPVPEGKVWSSEHGHWHDIQPVNRNIPQPEGPVPEGKVWSSEHGHWHTIQVVNKNIPQPDGPVPEGKVWSSEHGHWHNAPKQ